MKISLNKRSCFIVLMYFVFSISTTLFSTSTHRIDSLLDLLKSNKIDKAYVKNLNTLSSHYLKSNNNVKALYYANESQKVAITLNDGEGLVNAYFRLSDIYFATFNYDSVIRVANKIISICELSKNKIQIAKANQNLASAYSYKSDFKQSLQFFLKALRINVAIDDKFGIARIYCNMGLLFRKQKKYDKALEFLLISLKYNNNPKTDDEFYIQGQTYNNLGSIYFENIGDLNQALFYVTKSKEIKEKIGDIRGLAMSLNNLGAIYYAKKMKSKAIAFIIESLKISLKIEDKQSTIYSYSNIGEINYELNNLNESEKNFKKALEIAIKTEDKDIIRNSYLFLAKVFEKKKDYKQALTYQKLYTAINDSMFNLASNKQIAEMNTKYESELKDKELLKKDAEISLQQANSQKQTIIRNGFIIGFVFLLGLIVFIYRGYIQKQKTNKLLNDKNQKITDSINYAKLIQSSILPSQEDIQKYLPNSFIYYQPKDIVSGDFYWLYPINEQTVLFAVVDCTGHGVPGAMMSMLGYSLLEQIINQNKTTKPSEILDQLNFLVIESLKQSDQVDSVKNGMDMALFKLDFSNYELEYAGAKNPLYIVRDQNLIELKADKKSIGLSNGSPTPFVNQHVKLQLGDQLYAFSDGYIDQKGGSENKKFYSSNFQKMLLRINPLNSKDQQIEIENSFVNWKGNKEQIDDVLVFGIIV